MTSAARATVHGAVSIVNAIATGRGATLGTEQHVTATVEASPGKGIMLHANDGLISSRLISKTAGRILSKKILEKNRIIVRLESDIPAGYGLKSSSAISSATALACARLFDIKADDQKILLAGVDASIESKISITGAYDDACACYFGGFNVTDNYKKKLVLHEGGPKNMVAVIFIPKAKKRGNVRRLKTLNGIFERAWRLAGDSDYWNAMIINGLATSAILNSDPGIITGLLEKGAVGASISGNGPAIAAITRRENLAGIKKAFADNEGRIIVTKINNKKAHVCDA